jgi:hypothetical protein
MKQHVPQLLGSKNEFVLTVFARKIIIENAFSLDHTSFAVGINILCLFSSQCLIKTTALAEYVNRIFGHLSLVVTK